MARFRVLVSAPYFVPVVERYRERIESAGCEIVVANVRERLEEDELLRLIPGIHGVISGDDHFTENVFATARSLKVVAKWGTGVDSIDREAARRHGVRVCNTPKAFTDPVADSTLGYLLAFARRQPWMDRSMKQGAWEKTTGRALRECTLGIVGVGDIGKAVARRALAFGMRTFGNDVRDADPEWEALGIEFLSLDELLGRSDFVTLHCDLNPTSHHLISAATLERMRATAILINTARGPVVDETELVAALQRGQIAGAALDVFEREPLRPDHPLVSLDQVMLAPHNSNSSPAAWEHVHGSTVQQLLEALVGGAA